MLSTSFTADSHKIRVDATLPRALRPSICIFTMCLLPFQKLQAHDAASAYQTTPRHAELISLSRLSHATVIRTKFPARSLCVGRSPDVPDFSRFSMKRPYTFIEIRYVSIPLNCKTHGRVEERSLCILDSIIAFRKRISVKVSRCLTSTSRLV